MRLSAQASDNGFRYRRTANLPTPIVALVEAALAVPLDQEKAAA
jgi:hypothetical protein